MQERFNELWDKRNNAETSGEQKDYEQQMADVLRLYVSENYHDVDDPDHLIPALKRDFSSDLLPVVVADALECDIRRVRRYRYTRDRGVIDTHVGERKSIPPSIREEVKNRDNGVCTRCKEPHEDLTLHHIIPKSHGGVDHKSNMAMLCPMCHEDAHCGDFNAGRLAYEDKEEYWLEFCGYQEVPTEQS